MASVYKLFELACQHYASGNLGEAEKAYRKVLALDGRHADSLHLLGLIAHRQGEHGAALDLIGRAAALDGGDAAIHMVKSQKPVAFMLGPALLWHE